MIRRNLYARAAFALYLIAVWIITLLHDPLFLGGILAVLFVLSGRKFTHILRHVLKAVLAFNLTVTLAYAGLSYYRGMDPASTLVLLNVRVITLTWLTFLLIHRVQLSAALSFSSSLTFFLTLAWSQAHLYQKAYEDFRLALESRSPDPPGLRERFRMLAAAGRCLTDKSLHDSSECALAMESRMFFESRGMD